MADTNAKTVEATEVGAKRQSRDEELRARRAARDPGTLDRNRNLKLAIPDSVRAANADQQLRWVNDHGNRMHDLTEVDFYTKVDGVAPVPVGTDEAGKPIFAHLCRKPMDMFREDQADKAAVIDGKEREILAVAEKGSQIGGKSPPL